MPVELTVLAIVALVQVAQMVAFSVAANMQVDAKTALGPRDEPLHLKGTAGRLQRAMNNHFEGLILFAIASIYVHLAGQSTTLTATCAWVYLGARIAYVPAYVFGLTPWRSVVWCAGFGATTLMLIAGLV